MKLKELKDSLNKRFTSDFDDTEVIFQFGEDDPEFDCLGFVGMTKEMTAIILGSHKQALKMISEGKIKENLN